MMSIRQKLCAAALVGLGVIGSAATLHAAEFGDNTPYYEDDSILDVTEWFDGNDYNPTDEAWWRWDDETYQASKDTSGDSDSDSSLGYGYTKRDDDDWYYDRYDPYSYGYNDYGHAGLYGYGSHFYDYDNNGVYDAYTSYSDTDGDGVYDRYDYYSFDDKSTDKQKQKAKDEAAKESKQQSVTGKIQKTKNVQVRGGKQHVVVAIQPDSGQQSQILMADLGSAEDLKGTNPKVGDTITVKGPKAQVGDKSIVLAKSVEMNGQMTQINRNPRSITGKVLSTHKTKIRGAEHLMAMVETKRDDKMRKVAVDLGPADQLKMEVTKDSNLTFSGWPVTIKDKTLIMAQSVQQNDQTVQINRQMKSPGDKAQPAAAKQGQQQSDASKSPRVSDWPQVAQKAFEEMKQKYGEPNGSTPTRLVWTGKGPFKEIVLLNEAINHDFPKPHKDCLEHVVVFNVPTDKVGELAQFDGSVIVDRTRGTLSARCDSEAHNLMALNLAYDIINGKKNVEQARAAYGEAVKQQMNGQTPEIAKKLSFQPMPNAGDSDVATIGPAADQAQTAGDRQSPSNNEAPR